MKFKLLVLLSIALLPLLCFAQGSSLTIFSEDGDKFILFLNGAQQNTASQANLRLDGLMQPYYKAKIVFDDKAKAPVEKNIQVVDPATNASADVVYKIKNKDGDMKLRYFSAQPIQPGYVPPADVHVVHYGHPDQGTTVTQTTVTTTNTNNGGASITINPGGNVGVNVVPDPNNGSVTQTTTTTTSFSQTTTDNTMQQNPPACLYPMSWRDYKAAKATIAQASFEDTKLSTAKAILNSNCLSTDEVMDICRAFGFEASKLDFAKCAYARTTDPANYFKVGSVFSFDASKTDLNNYISSHAK